MFRIAPLFILLFILNTSVALCQDDLKIDFGSIISGTYKNSQSQVTPLQVNGGNGTFLSNWVMLIGAQINEKLAFYAEIQTVNGLRFINYGLSVIYQLDTEGLFNIEAGKFLVPFGTFLSRRWASENPLIDFPLIFEYRTALSAFDLPQNESELLRVRGQGNNFQYPHETRGTSNLKKGVQIFSGHLPRPGSGLRIISRQVYLTGFQIFGQSKKWRYHLGITNGALSNPADINNSNGLQILGRFSVSPFLGLEVGTSFARGSYLDKNSITDYLNENSGKVEDFKQTTLGGDLSYSIGHLLFYTEVLWNRWESPYIRNNLDAVAFYVEGKYTFLTRFYLASRFSLIDFKDINDPQDVDGDGRLRESWDYDVYQFEIGGGYRLNRNALIKALWQINRTREIPDPEDDLMAFQMVVFF